MFRRLFGPIERATERVVNLILDGAETATLRDEVERITARLAEKNEWATVQIGALTAEATGLRQRHEAQAKQLAMPVMAAWRRVNDAYWERQQTCAEPMINFAIACDGGSWCVRLEPQSQWSSRNIEGVWMCGGCAPDVDGAKAAVDIVLSHAHRLVGGSHGGPRWISAWHETVTRSIRHLHGYGRVASVSAAGWEVIAGNAVIASGTETGSMGRHLADVVLLDEYGEFEPLQDGVHPADVNGA